MNAGQRCRWQGLGRDFVEACRPSVIHRLVQQLASPGTVARTDWDRRGESGSWAQSLPRVAALLEQADLTNCHVLLEYKPHQAGRSRVDVILAGEAPTGQDTYVVVELKQWARCRLDPTDGLVHGTGAAYEPPEGLQDPYDQVANYSTFIRNYTAGMHDESKVLIHPVAYLHNATKSSIRSLFSADWHGERNVCAWRCHPRNGMISRRSAWCLRTDAGCLFASRASSRST